MKKEARKNDDKTLFSDLQRSVGQTCLHLKCEQCKGTGARADGSLCVHMVSCRCPKCSPKVL